MRLCLPPVKEWSFLLLVALVLASCGKTTAGPMTGLWVTDDKPYQDSTIEIAPGRIVFRDPLLPEPDVCTLDRIRLEKKEATSIVTLQYTNAEGVNFRRQVVYSGSGHGSFWFKNQPSVVWTRARSSSSADARETPNSILRGGASQ